MSPRNEQSASENNITDIVIDFYYEIFGQIFAENFAKNITDRLKRDEVRRDIERCAGAASRSLTRFFANEQMTASEVIEVLSHLRTACQKIQFETISKTGVAPESFMAALEDSIRSGEAITPQQEPAVRWALFLIIQSLLLVGPIMAEWQKLKFPTTFQLLNRVAGQLDRISQQIDSVRGGEPSTIDADVRFELSYRDYLMQRFYRVEAGTIRMTTNMNVDLRQLFVMPRVRRRKAVPKLPAAVKLDAGLMDLAAARRLFGQQESAGSSLSNKQASKERSHPALEQVHRADRIVFIGAPGSGKSTFLEWLQLQVAGADEPLFRNNEQAIPLLLRVRELDPANPPSGAAMIEKATGSKDVTALMPAGWLERQMVAGRILFILDGLDETEPKLVKDSLLPWIKKLCNDYARCVFLVSSRPVGYPPRLLQSLKFQECDLLDFDDEEVGEYTRHWCTSVRLARNEFEEEALKEGKREGEEIVAGFKGHPYIRNLARNPLMLSAICLVNYFERGELPKDRARLYKLCVEGLLHHWDNRRGIHSDFTVAEKLLACREVALDMQSADRAEWQTSSVLATFAEALGDESRAKELLEYVRYRTGLIIERRAGIFAFAHLTFQEYLTACAVLEGNLREIDATQLAREYSDGRWNEVIALYCGLAPNAAVRHLLNSLLKQPESEALAEVLTEAIVAAEPLLLRSGDFCEEVITRIARCPGDTWPPVIDRLPPGRVEHVAHKVIGVSAGPKIFSQAHHWLIQHSALVDGKQLAKRLMNWRKLRIQGLTELIHVCYRFVDDKTLQLLVDDVAVAEALRSDAERKDYKSPQEAALVGLSQRDYEATRSIPDVFVAALIQVFAAIAEVGTVFSSPYSLDQLASIVRMRNIPILEKDPFVRTVFAEHAFRAVEKLKAKHRWPADSFESWLRFSEANL